MKRFIISFLSLCGALSMQAQTDTTTFKGRIENAEYNVFIDMDFYHKNIIVPRQEVFGEMPGYFGDRKDSRCWFIVDADVKGKTAQLSISNDYGSEDLTATLTLNADGTYILEQIDGSMLKIARNRKWVKMPKKLVFDKAKMEK